MLYLEKNDETLSAELHKGGLGRSILERHRREVAAWLHERAEREKVSIYGFDATGLYLSRPGQAEPIGHLPLEFGPAAQEAVQLVLDGQTGFPRRLIDLPAAPQLWVTATQGYLLADPGHAWAIQSSRLLSPDSRFELLISRNPDYVLLSDRRHGSVMQLCPYSHRLLNRIELGPLSRPPELALQDDSLWLTAGDELLLWHLRSARLSPFGLRLGELGSLSLAPDSRYLLVQGQGARLHYLDTQTLESLKSLSLIHGDAFGTGPMLLSPDRAHWLIPILTTAGQAGVQLLDTERLQLQQRFVLTDAHQQLLGSETLNPFAEYPPNLATRLYQIDLLPAEHSLPNSDLDWPFTPVAEWVPAPAPLPPAATDAILTLLETPLPQGWHPLDAPLDTLRLATLASDLRQQLEHAEEARGPYPAPGSPEVVLRRDQLQTMLARNARSRFLDTIRPGLPGHYLLPLSESGRIVLLNPQREVVWELDLLPLGLSRPSDVRLLPHQRLLVTDSASSRVCELSFSGEITWEMGPDQGLVGPVKATWFAERGRENFVIVDLIAGRVLACDRHHRIDWDYTALVNPCDIQHSDQASFVVADSGLKAVLELDAKGQILSSPGAELGLVSPMFARLDAKHGLLIFDSEKQLILRKAPDGRVEKTAVSLLQPYFIDLEQPPGAPAELVFVSPNLIGAWHQGVAEAAWTLNPAHLPHAQASAPPAGQNRLAFLLTQPLFTDLPPTALGALAEALTPIQFNAGSVILHQNEPGEALYIIQSGRAEIIATLPKSQAAQPPTQPEGEQGTAILRLESGELFGELSLIFDEPRSNTIRAASDVQLLRLNKRTFYKLGRTYPELLKHLKQLAQERRYLVQQRRMDRVQAQAETAKARFALERLRQLHVFQGLEASHLERLQPYLRLKTYPAGSQIFAQGDPGDRLFFISIGNLEVFADDKRINVLPEGEVFGEIAVLLDTPRTASVVAQSYCELYSLDRASFMHAISPELRAQLETLARQRLTRSAAGDFSGATATALDQRSEEVHYPETVWGQSRQTSPVYTITPDRKAVAAIDARGRDVWHYGLHDLRLLLAPFSVVESGSRVLIADRGNHRILELDPARRTLLASVGDDRLRLLNPTCAAPSSDGGMLIADQGRLRLIEVRDNEIVWSFADSQQLLSPVWISAGPDNQVLYVDDLRHQVVLLDRQGQLQWSYGIPLHPGRGYFQLKEPRFAACLPDRHVLIADTGNDRLLEVDSEGAMVWSFEGSQQHPLKGPLYARRLANGNTLIIHQSWHDMLEIDSQGRAIWSCRLQELGPEIAHHG